MNILEALCGITIASSVAGYTLYQAEEVEAVVIEYDAQRKADTDAVMKWRKQVKVETVEIEEE